MMIIVETAIGFSRFDGFDPLLHVCRGEITLQHRDCSQPVEVTPMPYKKGLLGGLVPADDGLARRMVCQGCGSEVGPYHHAALVRSLRQFLTEPDWQTAPAQHLDESVWFVPPNWPPRRRRSPDRRRAQDRYTIDRSMEGRRRRDRDRRRNPTQLDFP